MSTTALVSDQKGFSFQPPPEVLAAFREHCRAKGLVQKDAAKAAFRMITLAPPGLRDLLMDGTDRQIRKWFEDAEKAILQVRTMQSFEQLVSQLKESLRDERRRGAGGTGQ